MSLQFSVLKRSRDLEEQTMLQQKGEELQVLQERVGHTHTHSHSHTLTHTHTLSHTLSHTLTHSLLLQYAAWEREGSAVREQQDRRVAELERKLREEEEEEEEETSGDATAEVCDHSLVQEAECIMGNVRSAVCFMSTQVMH